MTNKLQEMAFGRTYDLDGDEILLNYFGIYITKDQFIVGNPHGDNLTISLIGASGETYELFTIEDTKDGISKSFEQTLRGIGLDVIEEQHLSYVPNQFYSNLQSWSNDI